MTIREETRNLFTIPHGYYLAHCISGDFALGAGIALQFNQLYNMRDRLKSKYGRCSVNCSILVDNVFNLVTKRRAYDKPTDVSLHEALLDMADQVRSLGITKLAMPRIGCGLDGLEWTGVKELIEDTFDGMDVDIVICNLPQ